jgi:glycosyltransferase involved in cell wall biosynthesis
VARICLIRQGKYPLDPRLVSEVAAMVELGHEVDLICLRDRGQPGYERIGPVTIKRLPVPHQRGGWLSYLTEYAAFLIAAGTVASWGHMRRRYALVQVNTVPDVLVLAALVPRLLGARVLLDLVESMPEFVATKFGVGMRHPAVRLTARVEQASIRFADFAITCTAPMRQAFIARGAAEEKLAIVMNSYGLAYADDPTVPRIAKDPKDRSFVLICHGTIEERYGLDTLLRATDLLRDEIPNLRVQIIGDGTFRPAITALMTKLKLEERVCISPGWVPMDELLRAIAAADVGVVASKRDIFRDLVLCTKMFDFIGMRKPMIVSRTRAVEEYFGESCLEMFTADDPYDLARAIRRLHADAGRRRQLADAALRRSEGYRWEEQRSRYQALLTALIAGRRLGHVPAGPSHRGYEEELAVGE